MLKLERAELALKLLDFFFICWVLECLQIANILKHLYGSNQTQYDLELYVLTRIGDAGAKMYSADGQLFSA